MFVSVLKRVGGGLQGETLLAEQLVVEGARCGVAGKLSVTNDR